MVKVNVLLNEQQISLIRGILYNYYSVNEYYDITEKQLHSEVETIFTKAENQIYLKSS